MTQDLGYTTEEWRLACQATGINTKPWNCGMMFGHCFFCLFNNFFGREKRKLARKPPGDPATILAFAVFMFTYNAETTIHLSDDYCHLWSRTNSHTADAKTTNFAAAVVKACSSLSFLNKL